jgi:hypothetical protein
MVMAWIDGWRWQLGAIPFPFYFSFLSSFSFPSLLFFSFSPFLCTISLSPAPRARASLSFPSLLPFSFYGIIIINGPRLWFIPCEGKERIYYYYKAWGKTRGQVEMDSIGVRDGIGLDRGW